VANNLIDGGV